MMNAHPGKKIASPNSLFLRQVHENLLEDIPTLVKIQQPKPLLVQMRRIARLSTREVRRRSIKLLLQEPDSRDRTALADVERFAARWSSRFGVGGESGEFGGKLGGEVGWSCCDVDGGGNAAVGEDGGCCGGEFAVEVGGW